MNASHPRHVAALLGILFSGAIFSVSSTSWAARRHHRVPAPRTASLAHQIDSLLSSPAAEQAQWGISVTTLEGSVLYEKNDAQLFAPASNAKLFTTAAALALLGPNATTETRVIAPAAPANGIVRGDVTLLGAGDASLSGRAYPYDGKTDRPNPPLIALESLADQVQQHGVHHIEGNIVGDDTAFPWEPYGAGWAWDDLEWSWGAPVSALTVNDNVVYLAIMPGTQPGDPLTFAWNPDVANSYYTVSNTGRTSAPGSQPSLGLDRQLGAREIRIFGTLPAGGAAKHLALAIQDPAAFAAIAFRQMLAARGITITGAAVAHHRLPIDTAIYEQSILRPLLLPQPTAITALKIDPLQPGAVVLASRTSVPLLQDVTITDKVSQNLHAEILLRLLGKQFGEDGSTVEGARVIRAFNLQAGIAPSDFFFYDGSGLSPNDRVAPRAFTTLLRYAAAQPWGTQFRAALPTGGIDGTLSSRFTRSSMQGRVSAKTGTLDEVNSLSGYVITSSGRTLVFSILCNGHLPQARGVTQIIDMVVTDLAASQ
jgi:D-alanyl-D-alanine carboxypeptidase/D-alanyl-D-alanine-endopeptidase (penicillin-binding protein 4)